MKRGLDILRGKVIQAPMAGATNPSFVSKCSNLGFLGSLACGYMKPSKIAEDISNIKNLTEKPFAINLFVARNVPDYQAAVKADGGAILSSIKKVYREAKVEFVEPSFPSCVPSFSEQLAVVLANPPAVVSFTFGIINSEELGKLHEKGVVVVGTATNKAEAEAWRDVGADAVVLQGREAGGHRATWIGPEKDSLFYLNDLIEATSSVDIPIIPAGGIMTAQRVQELFGNPSVLAVAIGTTLLMSEEAPIPKQFKHTLTTVSRPDEIDNTFAFSGKMAKGVVNSTFKELASSHYPYPIQHFLTSRLRSESGATGEDTDHLSMWCGDGAIHRSSVKPLEEIAAEFDVSQ